MSFCTITPTRGDRPQFLEFCKHQLSRMTVKPDKSYFIDYKPVSDQVDLIPRVVEGVRQAAQDGFKEIFIVEEDDYYPSDYFETMALGYEADFVGSQKTIYYNIKDRRYQEMHHPSRSSMFITGFRIGVLDGFNWPSRNSIHLDIALWNHAQRKFKRKFVETGAIGIKHGVGKCAGAGHYKPLRQSDPDMNWLKEHVDNEAFVFYKSVKV